MRKHIFIYFGLFVLYLSSTEGKSNEIFLIPQNYRGKVSIIYNQPNGELEEWEGQSRLYRIPESGILLSKFRDEYGEFNQRFFFVDSIGHREEIQIVIDESVIHNDSLVSIFRAGTIGVLG